APGEWRLRPDERAARWRRELEAPGVEEQPPERLGGRAAHVRPTPRRPRAVERGARVRVTDWCEVDPALVRPAGDESQLEERPAGDPLADPVAGRCRPAVGDDAHP